MSTDNSTRTPPGSLSPAGKTNENSEVDYSDPTECMNSTDLVTLALGNVKLIRDTHWSDNDRIGVPLDDDNPDDPGGADRLAAAMCAISALEILQARDQSVSEEPEFTLLIDPPHCSSDTSSAGLLFGLQGWASLIESVAPCDPVNGEICQDLLRAMAPSLLLITQELGHRMMGNLPLEAEVADAIALAIRNSAG